jgi:RNA polymerase sigma factor (sigma-70 family)
MRLQPGITEDELIRLCKTGNLSYLEMLYKHFYGYAMGIAVRYFINRDDAVEVVNDSFIKIFNRISSFENGKPFKAWLKVIVVNTSLDKRRKELKHLYADDLEAVMDVSYDAGLIEKLSAGEILSMLNELPDVQRVVFNLFEIDGYSHNEIAKMLGLTASTSRVYLARAKERLRAAINKAEKPV